MQAILHCFRDSARHHHSKHSEQQSVSLLLRKHTNLIFVQYVYFFLRDETLYRLQQFQNGSEADRYRTLGHFRRV